MLNFAAICPHPPLIIPQIGKSQLSLVKKTVHAMETLSAELKKHKPDTLVVISPHGPMRYDKFTINLNEKFKGNFSGFGEDNDGYSFSNDTELARLLLKHLRDKHFPTELIRESKIDHGTLVPLHYLAGSLEPKPRLLPLTFTALDWKTHFKLGRTLGDIFENVEQNVALIASGDLSHRLNENAPAGFSPYGTKFDYTLIDLLKKNEVEKIMNLNPDFCEEAGECGLRSIILALGILSKQKYNFKQISYEGPLGVGHLVGHWKIG